MIRATAAIDVITSEDIRRSGAGTLLDLLRLAAGLSVARWRSDRLDLSLIGRDLLLERHADFGAASPLRRLFQREVLGRATLRF